MEHKFKRQISEEEIQKIKDKLIYNKESGIFYKKLKSGATKVAGGNTGDGYISINLNNKIYRAHHLAWLFEYGNFPEEKIKHINKIKTDNRIQNLTLETKDSKDHKDTIFFLKKIKNGKPYGPKLEQKRIPLDEIAQGKYDGEILWVTPLNKKFKPKKMIVVQNKKLDKLHHSKSYLQELDKTEYIELSYSRPIKLYNKKGQELIAVFSSRRMCVNYYNENEPIEYPLEKKYKKQKERQNRLLG